MAEKDWYQMTMDERNAMNRALDDHVECIHGRKISEYCGWCLEGSVHPKRDGMSDLERERRRLQADGKAESLQTDG